MLTPMLISNTNNANIKTTKKEQELGIDLEITEEEKQQMNEWRKYLMAPDTEGPLNFTAAQPHNNNNNSSSNNNNNGSSSSTNLTNLCQLP